MALSKVKIAKVEASGQRRRLLAEGISVTTEVAANDASAAQTVAGNLSQENLNAQLVQAGLPQATILEAPSVVETGTKTSKQGSRAVVIALAILGSLAGVALLVAAYVYLSRRTAVAKAPQEPAGDVYDPEDRPAPRGIDSHDGGSEYVQVAGAAHTRRAACLSYDMMFASFAAGYHVSDLRRMLTTGLDLLEPVHLQEREEESEEGHCAAQPEDVERCFPTLFPLEPNRKACLTRTPARHSRWSVPALAW